MNKKSIENNFDEVWERISNETGLKSLRQLAVIIDKKQPTISAAKAKGEFPPSWAYVIGRKYGILTEWIMTGIGPKRIEELQEKKQQYEITKEINEWISEMTQKEPFRKDWFRGAFEDSFPAFKEWKREKKTIVEEADSTIYEKRVGNGWK